MADEVDLIADLNAEDDDGLGWSTLADASDPERVVPGAMLLAGNRYGQALIGTILAPRQLPTGGYQEAKARRAVRCRRVPPRTEPSRPVR